MTLEQLRPLLAHYDTAGAVLRVLEFGSFTAMGLIEATGKGRRAVYAALASLEAAQLVQKTAQEGVQNPALAYQLSAKSCTPPVQNPALTPESGAENCTDNPLSVQNPAQGEGVQNPAQPQNAVQDEENDECKKLHSLETDVNVLKSLSLKSLKEKELKDPDVFNNTLFGEGLETPFLESGFGPKQPSPLPPSQPPVQISPIESAPETPSDASEGVNYPVTWDALGKDTAPPLCKPVKSPTVKPAPAKPTREQCQQLLEVYNAYRGSLPQAKTLDRKRETNLGQIIKTFGFDRALTLIQHATQEVAQDEYWMQQKYNLDNLFRHYLSKAEKWEARLEAQQPQPVGTVTLMPSGAPSVTKSRTQQRYEKILRAVSNGEKVF